MSLELIRPKTLTEQVNLILRERIHDKTYPPGGRLPSEVELSEEFGVSRSTIRSALSRLAAEGLLLRKHGNGTYINSRLQGVNTNWGGLWEFGELIEKNGYQVAIKLLNIEKKPAKGNISLELNVPEGEEVVELQRLFFADDHPVILVKNFIPAKYLMNLSNHIDGQLSLREITEQYTRVRIAYAISSVRATLARDEIAVILEKNPDSPLLNLEITFYDINNIPIVTGSSYYDDTVLNLRLVQAWQ